MEEQGFIESREEMEELLREEEIGYLGLSLDGEPYVVPLNYSYADGKIYFHCGLKGKKLVCMTANPQVCFTVAVSWRRFASTPGETRAMWTATV